MDPNSLKQQFACVFAILSSYVSTHETSLQRCITMRQQTNPLQRTEQYLIVYGR